MFPQWKAFFKILIMWNQKPHFLEEVDLFYLFPLRNDAAQSDDDDKSQAPLTDTDGGKLKQKT